MERALRGLSIVRPAELRGEPPCQEQRGRAKSRREIDLNALDFIEARVGPGVVEELSKREPNLDEPGPIQIAENDSLLRVGLSRFQALDLGAEIVPALAVVNNAIDPRPELRVHRVGKFALPPEIEREIGIELGKNDVRQEPRRRSFEQKRELFRTDLFVAGAADVAMHVDPRLDPVLFRGGVRADHDRTAGMVFGDFGNDFRVHRQRGGRFTVDREIDQRRPRLRPAAFRPKSLQLPIDLPDLDRDARRKSFSGGRHVRENNDRTLSVEGTGQKSARPTKRRARGDNPRL
jgi:hypothetical protein